MRIQQWSVAETELCPVGEESVVVVLYADHVRAVAKAEKRGFDNGVLFEIGRVTEELDRLRKVTAFGSKPGYRQGFIGCWSLVRGIVKRGEAAPSRGTS